MSTNTEKREEDQANELRHLFQDEAQKDQAPVEEDLERVEREIDLLNLPPRKEVHGKAKRMKLKTSKAFLRFSAVIFIVILSLSGAIYFWRDELAVFFSNL